MNSRILRQPEARHEEDGPLVASYGLSGAIRAAASHRLAHQKERSQNQTEPRRPPPIYANGGELINNSRRLAQFRGIVCDPDQRMS